MSGIGLRLKEERLRLNLTQTDLAAVAGVSKGAQIAWEKGTTTPPAAVLVAYAERGVDLDYVLLGRRSDGVSRLISALHERQALKDLENSVRVDPVSEDAKHALQTIATSPSDWISEGLREKADNILIEYYDDGDARHRRSDKIMEILRFRKQFEQDLEAALRNLDLSLAQSIRHRLVMLCCDHRINISEVLPLLQELKAEQVAATSSRFK